MLDIKKLDELSKVINLKKLCNDSGLNYYKIINKIYRFRENPTNGELSLKDTHALMIVLSHYGIILRV